MKPLLLLVLVAALSSSVCRKSDINKLDELPKDIAENLKRIPDSNVFVSMTPIADPNPPPPPVFAPNCSETQTFWVQVMYPVTVCTPFDLIPSTFMADAPPRSSGPRATTVKNYKLTALAGQPLATPFGCQRRSGPFIAVITRERSCSNWTSCSMEIIGVPSCPTCGGFAWSGDNCEENNRPAEVQFIGPSVAKGKPKLTPCNSQSNCGSSPPPTNP